MNVFYKLNHQPRQGPSLPQLAVNAATAAGRVGAAVVTRKPILADDETVEARRTVCKTCEQYDLDKVRCTHFKCGCFLAGVGASPSHPRGWGKWRLLTEDCPLGKWPKFSPIKT